MIAPRQQRVTRRRTHPARSMGIGEAHALRGQLVNVRRRNFAALRVVAMHVTIAEVVGQDDEDVRFGFGRCGTGGKGEHANCGGDKIRDEGLHG